MTVDDSRAAFLHELTRRHDGLIVWKHLDRALRGQGDIDAAAPSDQVAAISQDAIAIGRRTLGASHVIMCGHVADKRLQFFVQPDRLPQLFEFDLSLQPSRGLSPWAAPRAMLGVAEVRSNGIRTLRAGAEAVVSLVYHGISLHGRDRLANDERAIVTHGLSVDFDGALQACASLPPRLARRPLTALVHKLATGEWNRAEARLAYMGFVAAGPANVAYFRRRVVFRARLASGGDCVMSRLARLHDRRVPSTGLDLLMREAAADGHAVRALEV